MPCSIVSSLVDALSTLSKTLRPTKYHGKRFKQKQASPSYRGAAAFRDWGGPTQHPDCHWVIGFSAFGAGTPQQPAAPGTQRPSAAGATPPAAQELTQTATIRNAVNLKKSTLSVQAAPGAPGKLSVSFSFDASAPAAVTVFFGAREDLQRGCQLTAASTLLGETPDVYALAVRLETVTEAGAAEGRRLEELQPGAPQPAWVQSQTTFAYLHREEEGVYAVRVCKQKIWVEGVSYELQEIYGLEQSGMIPAAPGAADDSEERLCVICLVNDRDTTVLPCRHMCMCHECAQELRKQTSKCPICRNHVESLLHIKMSKGARKAAASAAGAAAV
ncbi:hypothetical protein QBZ16_002859 [Prototheca wickerhamii]|uniref:RING-type E3 ubiquitin transferase n=1 Tax=Prototheca wickerhamii TaxID=3111 RepID=A0AAD9IKE1_PROWI|nr:hypothetical protein QBZ16_002859 [Prototheca wickerhamii]